MSFFDAANASASSSSEDEDEETETETETETRERVEVVEEASSHRRGMNDFEHHSVPRASDVLAALDDGASACGVSALVARRRVRPDMASAVEASMEDRAGNSYYGGGGGGTKRTDGEEEEEYDRRAATIRVDARKIRFVEHRVAVRLTSSEGNGVGESVRATGARVAVDDDVVDDDADHPVDDREERRVSIVGPPECVQRCVELIEALVRETKNQTSKKFYCPRAFLGAFLGRGRGNAKKIEGVSKCKIVIADVDKVHEGNEHAVVRAIEVTGTPAQVSLGYKLALQNLDDALKTTPGADVDWVKAELKDATGFDVDDERARVKRRKEMADR
jgi:hypothetical protein|tara:strand:- start:4024 stop:5022 length:999 start_codon:yes stop_codon:yes gene_type:complete